MAGGGARCLTCTPLAQQKVAVKRLQLKRVAQHMAGGGARGLTCKSWLTTGGQLKHVRAAGGLIRDQRSLPWVVDCCGAGASHNDSSVMLVCRGGCGVRGKMGRRA